MTDPTQIGEFVELLYYLSIKKYTIRKDQDGLYTLKKIRWDFDQRVIGSIVEYLFAR
jgi:hypothetical protein